LDVDDALPLFGPGDVVLDGLGGGLGGTSTSPAWGVESESRVRLGACSFRCSELGAGSGGGLVPERDADCEEAAPGTSTFLLDPAGSSLSEW